VDDQLQQILLYPRLPPIALFGPSFWYSPLLARFRGRVLRVNGSSA
jgi:hypothetical protein